MSNVGLALINDSEKSFVIEVQFQNKAALTLPNVSKVSFAIRALRIRYLVAKPRFETCSKYLVVFPHFEM